MRVSLPKSIAPIARRLAAWVFRRLEAGADHERRRAAISQLGACGSNVGIGKGCVMINPGNIFLGSSVHVGDGAHLSAMHAPIKIGSKVMLAPHVAIITGNHNTGVVGVPMFDVKEKRPFDDMPVTVEDDVWIGFGAILLKGTRIGRGSVVGAGAVVMGKIRPYSVVAGNPASVLFMRFDKETIAKHESEIRRRGEA